MEKSRTPESVPAFSWGIKFLACWASYSPLQSGFSGPFLVKSPFPQRCAKKGALRYYKNRLCSISEIADLRRKLRKIDVPENAIDFAALWGSVKFLVVWALMTIAKSVSAGNYFIRNRFL